MRLCGALSCVLILGVFVVGCGSSSVRAAEPERRPLWEGEAPLAKGNGEADTPNVTIYRPEEPNGCTIVVCPGGGYGHLAVGHEGQEIAEWLNSFGVTAYVLRYRIRPYQHPVPLLDVSRAVRTVRFDASKDGSELDPNRIGIIGFSAGGHLVSTISTHFDAGDENATDPVDRFPSRPDFAILCYPVISMTEGVTHRGSKRNLLGTEPGAKLVELLSNEKQVTKQTPPTFLWHTQEDPVVKVENALLYYLALCKQGVTAEMHIYERGRHGIGLAKGHPNASEWPERCREWIALHGFLKPKS